MFEKMKNVPPISGKLKSCHVLRTGGDRGPSVDVQL